MCQPQRSPAVGWLLLEYPLGLTNVGGLDCAKGSSPVLLSGPALQSKPHSANQGFCQQQHGLVCTLQCRLVLRSGTTFAFDNTPSWQQSMHLARQRAAQHSFVQRVPLTPVGSPIRSSAASRKLHSCQVNHLLHTTLHAPYVLDGHLLVCSTLSSVEACCSALCSWVLLSPTARRCCRSRSASRRSASASAAT